MVTTLNVWLRNFHQRFNDGMACLAGTSQDRIQNGEGPFSMLETGRTFLAGLGLNNCNNWRTVIIIDLFLIDSGLLTFTKRSNHLFEHLANCLREVYSQIVATRTKNVGRGNEIFLGEEKFINDEYVQELLISGKLFDYKPRLEQRYLKIVQESFNEVFGDARELPIDDELVSKFSAAIGITEDSHPIDVIAALDDFNYMAFPEEDEHTDFFGTLMTLCLEEALCNHYNGRLVKRNGTDRIVEVADKRINTHSAIETLIKNETDFSLYKLVVHLEQIAGRPAYYAVSNLKILSAMITNIEDSSDQPMPMKAG